MLMTKSSDKKKFWTKKKILIGISIILLLGGGLGWWLNSHNSKAQNATVLPTFEASVSDITESLSLSGTVASAYLTEITTKAEGVISTVYVQNGDYVEEGDKLFEIELTPTAEQSMQSAYNSYVSSQNNLSSAQAQLYSAQSTLFNKNQYFINHAIEEDLATTDPTYIQQQADWLAAEASYKNQESQIALSQKQVNAAYLNYQNYSNIVTAPVSGEVAGMAITEGMVVTNTEDADMSLGSIKNGETYVVQVSVSEMDIASIQVGQTAYVTITAVGDDVTFEGTVISIDTVGSYSSSSGAVYPVLINFATSDDTNYTILPNMSADVEIMINEKSQVIALSTLALQSDSAGYFVNVINENGNIERRSITLGIQTDDLTEITSGLEAGEKVQMGEFSITSDEEETGMMMMGGGMDSNMRGSNSGMGGPPGGM